MCKTSTIKCLRCYDEDSWWDVEEEMFDSTYGNLETFRREID